MPELNFLKNRPLRYSDEKISEIQKIPATFKKVALMYSLKRNER
jgi:hypothetical protein